MIFSSVSYTLTIFMLWWPTFFNSSIVLLVLRDAVGEKNRVLNLRHEVPERHVSVLDRRYFKKIKAKYFHPARVKIQ